MDFSWCKHSQPIWFSPGREGGLDRDALRMQRVISELLDHITSMGIQCDGTFSRALATGVKYRVPVLSWLIPDLGKQQKPRTAQRPYLQEVCALKHHAWPLGPE